MELTWRQFVSAYAGILAQTAWRVLGNEADVEEVIQEVFLEIHRGNRFTALFDQPALLKTIATRRALDCLRRRKPTQSLESRTLDFQENHSKENDPESLAIARETEYRIRELLRGFPPREAEVFCLVCWENRSQDEVASLLGISSGAVAKALCKARERLSNLLTESSTEGST